MSSAISCDVTALSNNAKLYWQFTCDRIWLTLEKKDGKKFVIDEVPVDVYPYTYRLGYQLIKEYRNSLLFRSGCAASGPCSYFLIDKNDGVVVRQFGQLICIDTDIEYGNPHSYEFEFVVYLSPDADELIVFFVNDSRVLKVPFKEKLVGVIPEHQFKTMTLQNNRLQILYTDHNEKMKTIHVNLSQR